MDFDTFYTSNGFQDLRAEEDPEGEAEGYGNQGQEEGGSFQGKSTTCQERNGARRGGRDGEASDVYDWGLVEASP